jgi:hypothetical protein
MNFHILLIQTGITFVAATLGATFGAFLARRNEQLKHLQELRSNAYADFLRGFAKVGRAQQDGGDRVSELDGRLIVTDARSRIAIYGSPGVIHALAQFIDLGTQTLSPEGQRAFAKLCSLMRDETMRQSTAIREIETVLFS